MIIELLSYIFQFLKDHFFISIVVFACCLKVWFGSGKIDEYPDNRVEEVLSMDQWNTIISETTKTKEIIVVDFFAVW